MSRSTVDKNDAYRVLLTETLPYETPLFFSNEKFYYAAKRGVSALPSLAREILSHSKAAKPLSYAIRRGARGLRRLSIPHPAVQIRFCSFYESYDGFIQSLCKKSSLSLRFPSRVASSYFESQYSVVDEAQGIGPSDTDPASFSQQRKWASSYFAYRRYDQMHKFFGSDEFLELERSYEKLVHIDVARCFDSIYTHSLFWAVRGKETAKRSTRRHCFENQFDELMQHSNWNETNGIVIGPEVSRIFAEIIFQSIDASIERAVAERGLHVAIRRYIDDFLIFGNDERDLSEAQRIIRDGVSAFKLHINESKTVVFERPLLSKISVARDMAIKAVTSYYDSVDEALRAKGDAGTTEAMLRAGLDRECLNEVRKACRSMDTAYALVVAPCLAVLVRRTVRLRQRTAGELTGSQEQFDRVATSILRLAGSLLSLDTKASTAQKVSRLFCEITYLASAIGRRSRALQNEIMDVTRRCLELASRSALLGDDPVSGPELISLVVTATGVSSGVSSRDVRTLMLTSLQLSDPPSRSELKTIGYFDLAAVLYFARRRRRLADLRRLVVDEIRRRILGAGRDLRFDSEATMLFFDLLSCPHVDEVEKVEIYRKVSETVLNSKPSEADARGFVRHCARELGWVDWSAGARLPLALQKRELQPSYG